MRKSSKTNKANCKICNKEFMTLKNEFCSTSCRNIYYARTEAEAITGTEGIDYVTCKWCGMKSKRLYLGHFKVHHPGKTTDDYRREFPDAPLACKTDNQNVAKAYVRFTKSEEGRQYLSDRIKGENNPNSKNNATEEERKSRSPFSSAFYTKLGFTEDEAKEKVTEFAKYATADRLTETQLEYWVLRTNGDVELAKDLLKKRQQTFSLEKCIERLGEDEGKKRWQERQNRWKGKVFNDVQWIGGGKSKVSHELFSLITSESSKYKNEKYIRNENKTYKYDFCDSERRKIIEFNGDFWHCNPIHFTADFYHPVRKQTAQELWDYDNQKLEIAKLHRYEVLTVWEKEYREDPEATIQKCIDFLNAKVFT